MLLWQDMANRCVELSGRTWGSLKGRYLKCIKPNIEKYGLQSSVVMKFLCKSKYRYPLNVIMIIMIKKKVDSYKIIVILEFVCWYGVLL